MSREDQNDPNRTFRGMPQWPAGASEDHPAEETPASRFWAWWLGRHLTPIQKTLFVVLVLPPVVLMIVLKWSWDAENRAKAERAWKERKETEKKLADEVRRLEKESEKFRPFTEFMAARARAKAAREGVTYFCPLHPQIVREDVAECPICLMTMVRVNQAGLSAEEKQLFADQGYVCPVDSTSIFLGKAQAKVMIKGKTVLVCCKECETRALAEPDKTLAAVEKLKLQFRKEYAVRAKVTSIDAQERSVVLAHDGIPELVEAGPSRFSVEDAKMLEGVKPGDNVQGRAIVRSGSYVLTQLEKR
jgi:Cu/Ag efflux protein CusF